jgi:polar amino acid transport system substrate-binding protein
MSNKKYFGIAILLASALILGACSSTGTEAAADEAAVEETELTYDESGIPQYGCLGSADTALVDLECREVTVAIENAYPEFNYIDEETGLAGGWDYVVVPEICEMLHCTPVFQECSWDIMIQSVADGLYDMAADGITITEERDEIVDFSDPYIANVQRILVNTGEDRFASFEDFVANEDLILGTQTGTTNYIIATEYLPEERISAFEQYPFAVQSLLSNDVDAVLLDEQVGIGYVNQNEGNLELFDEEISSDYLGFVFPNGSDLVDPFNQALAELKSNGFLDEVNAEFFGE